MQEDSTIKTYGALISAIVIWGLSFVATKIALKGFSPFCLIFFRFFAASLFFMVLMSRSGFPKFTKSVKRKLFLTALFQPGLYFTFETLGLQYTTASKASLIIATIPIVVLLLSVLFLRERVNWINISGILVSICGVFLLIAGGGKGISPIQGVMFGDLLMFGAVISAAIYIINIRSLGETLSPIHITGMQSIFGALIFFPAFLRELPGVQWSLVTAESLFALAGLTLFATIGAFLCYNYALSRMPAPRASVYLNGVPVVTAMGAWAILGEKLSPVQLCGGAIVLVSVYLASFVPETRKQAGMKKIQLEM